VWYVVPLAKPHKALPAPPVSTALPVDQEEGVTPTPTLPPVYTSPLSPANAPPELY